jgi:hypothetical protein
VATSTVDGRARNYRGHGSSDWACRQAPSPFRHRRWLQLLSWAVTQRDAKAQVSGKGPPQLLHEQWCQTRRRPGRRRVPRNQAKALLPRGRLPRADDRGPPPPHTHTHTRATNLRLRHAREATWHRGCRTEHAKAACLSVACALRWWSNRGPRARTRLWNLGWQGGAARVGTPFSPAALLTSRWAAQPQARQPLHPPAPV